MISANHLNTIFFYLLKLASAENFKLPFEETDWHEASAKLSKMHCKLPVNAQNVFQLYIYIRMYI